MLGNLKSEYIVTDIENEKIIPPLRLMTRSEIMNDLLKLLSIVQKHGDKEGCQHCLDLRQLNFTPNYMIKYSINFAQLNG
jgi:hypothetical protein